MDLEQRDQVPQLDGRFIELDGPKSKVDEMDAIYKIQSYLNTHLSHFSQNFKADDVYIQVCRSLVKQFYSFIVFTFTNFLFFNL